MEDKLIIVTAYGEQHEVKLQGYCYNVLGVPDTKIDYGPCELDIDHLTRSIILENHDNSQRLPVSLEFSSPEFYQDCRSIDQSTGKGNLGIVLEPSERVKLPIHFRPNYAGQRNETLLVSAPNSSSQLIQLSARVNCNPIISFSQNVYVPAVPPRSQSSIIVPIYNPYYQGAMGPGGIATGGCQFIVSMSKKSAFTLKASGIFPANSQIVTCQPSDAADPGMDSYRVTFSKPGTFFMDLSFNPSKGGVYRTNIQILMQMPRKMAAPTSSINVYGLCMSENFYKSKGIQPLRQLYGQEEEKRRTFQDYDWILGDIVEPLQAPPDIFKCSRAFISIVSNPSNSRFKPTLTITNTSAIQQKFQLLISYPFVTDFDLTGILYPQKSIDIPIGIDRNYFEMNVGDERSTVVGCLTVIDDYGKSMGGCSLFASIHDT